LWAALPVLFTAAVVGLTSLAEVLLNSPGDVVLTSGHLGVAAAVTASAGLPIEWHPRLRAARWAYPLAIFTLGLAVHGVDVPTVPALAVGLPGAAALTWMAYAYRFCPDDLVSGLATGHSRGVKP